VAAVEAKQAKFDEQDADTPETALIAKTNRARLEAAIGSLSLPYRETFTLREVEGLNYREIAEITGVPIGTVMSRLSRARDQLDDMIERNRL
jgi:RNA polymerase sigma-70 factor (ECF subfamily)